MPVFYHSAQQTKENRKEENIFGMIYIRIFSFINESIHIFDNILFVYKIFMIISILYSF